MSQTATTATLVRLPATILATVQRVLGDDIDPVEAAGRLRRIGMEIGEELLATLRERAAASGAVQDMNSQSFWGSLAELFQQLGWGSLEHERLHPGVISLSSPDWFESRSREAAQPACHFTVGALAAVFGAVGAGEVAVLEVRCEAHGDGECRFLIGGPETLEAVFDQMADGRSYREAISGLG